MAKMQFFTIVTVTYNNISGPRPTGVSLNAQRCRDFEWIIVDGGSRDGTAAFLKDYPDAISEPDNGLYDAMNKGTARARGEYLLFLNAHDTLADSETLEKIQAQAYAADFIYGDSLEDGHYKRARTHASKNWGMFTHHQAMLYRREVIGNLRYKINYKIGAAGPTIICAL